MMYSGSGFGGMHFFWWLFWIVSIAMFFSFVVPVPRRRYSQFRDTPLDLLRRRYASGELTTAEFDERRERLVADGPGQDSRRPLKQEPSNPAPPAEHLPH